MYHPYVVCSFLLTLSFCPIPPLSSVSDADNGIAEDKSDTALETSEIHPSTSADAESFLSNVFNDTNPEMLRPRHESNLGRGSSVEEGPHPRGINCDVYVVYCVHCAPGGK